MHDVDGALLQRGDRVEVIMPWGVQPDLCVGRVGGVEAAAGPAAVLVTFRDPGRPAPVDRRILPATCLRKVPG